MGRAMGEFGQVRLPWPDWQIVRLLGSGTFGRVYEAEKKNDGFVSHAAVKVMSIPAQRQEVYELKASGMSDPEIDRHFLQTAKKLNNEIAFMEQLKSAANIVSIYDSAIVRSENGIGYELFMRMELLTDLNSYFYSVRNGQVTVKDVIKVGCDICSALSACEKKNIIHRDIKTSNILVSEYGDYKLSDFGVSRHKEHTQTYMSMQGTYHYMAPEVFRRDRNYDHTVDIYSLGLVLYRLLNYGKIPFIDPFGPIPSADEMEEAQRRRMTGEALPNPALGGKELAAIIRKASSYRPEERFQRAEDMREALMSCSYRMDRSELEKVITRNTANAAQKRSESQNRRSFSNEAIRTASAPRRAEYTPAPDPERTEAEIPSFRQEQGSRTGSSDSQRAVEKPKKKKGRNVKWLIAVVYLIVLSAGGYFAWNRIALKNNETEMTPEYDTDVFQHMSYVVDSNGNAKITGWATDSRFIKLPEMVEGHNVTEIGANAFVQHKNLEGIILPEGLQRINTKAFCGCIALKEITIPNSVTEIDQEAFLGCESLETVKLPVGITKISSYTFYKCHSLSEIEIPAEVTRIGKKAFAECSSLVEVSFAVSGGIEDMGEEAFDKWVHYTDSTLAVKREL
ncbi:MAG: leucine-rich repeat protein [Eubacteriales bacterium]|nr:leucine-rich repeat protein [Eubacteriales bacterium]